VSAAKTSPAATIPEGEYVTIPAEEGDIGGQLLPILSKGLYTNPLDCIREYVQNAVDAGAKHVNIRITGNGVTIHDTGQGMDEEQLKAARKFGISAKDLAHHVGFRGIGIYSGYDLSNRLIITTKKKGSSLQYVMRFDFFAMKKELETKPAGSVSLEALLTRFTTFKKEATHDPSSSFTIVELEEINDVHLRKIANRSELRHYILQNLPVDFDKRFDYRGEINTYLSTNVPGYNAVTIKLQSDGEKDEIVSKPPLTKLRAPQFGSIKGADNKVLAYFWACLNQENGILGDNNLTLTTKGHFKPSDWQGFAYKCKGFTIGNRNQLVKMFTLGNGTLYRWYTGEIYVIDDQVIPNTARDDFESNAAKSNLEIAVGETMGELESTADDIRERTRSELKITEALKQLTALQAEVNSNGADSFDDYDRVRDIKSQLKRYKAKASADIRDKADQALKTVEKLDKQIRATVGRSVGASTSTRTKRRGTTPATAPPEPVYRTLTDVLEELDAFDAYDVQVVLKAVETALTTVLSTDSIAYQKIVTLIEASLQDE
jgi:hypothetical protein